MCVQARWSESCVQLLTRLVNCCAICTRNITKRYGAFSFTVSIGFLTAWHKGSTSYGLYGRKCRWKSVSRKMKKKLFPVLVRLLCQCFSHKYKQVINKCTCWNGLAIALRCLIQHDILVTCDCILHGDAVFSQISCAPPLWAVVSLIK